MMIQYVITGGQLHMDKKAFARELLLPDSLIKKLLYSAETQANKKPKIIKTESDVTIDFNDAVDVLLEENFYDVFRNLKIKYQNKISGRVVIRITALTSYHVVMDLNSEDGRIMYD